MIIGIPKEIKNNENRVALTPAGAKELVKRGHTVYVQHTAGINSGFADDAYVAAGARILPAIEDVYGIAEMIVKVKEPIASEYPLVRKGQLVFTYFHFASDEALTLAMIKSGSICLAYETVENPDHTLPLLIPMSEVAGRMSVQEGARFLEKPQGGKGVLLGGVPGVKPGKKTVEYLDTIMTRITLPGSIFLAIVAILPTFAMKLGINNQFALFYGGTSLLILVGVVLDTLQQIESYLLLRHYDGLMKTGRIKGRVG